MVSSSLHRLSLLWPHCKRDRSYHERNRYQLQSRKPSEKFGWNAWDLRQNSPAMTCRGSLEITENWLYKKRLCTVVTIHSESRNMLTASELSHSMASKQNKTDLKSLDRRTRQVGVFLNKCISKTIYTDIWPAENRNISAWERTVRRRETMQTVPKKWIYTESAYLVHKLTRSRRPYSWRRTYSSADWVHFWSQKA